MSYTMDSFPLIRSYVQEKRSKYPAGALKKLDMLDGEQLAGFLAGLRQIIRFLPNSFTPSVPISKVQHDLLLYAANNADSSLEKYISAEWAAHDLRTNVETVLNTARELHEKGLVKKITHKRGEDPKKAEIIPTLYGMDIIKGTVGTIYEIMNSAVNDFSDDELAEYIRLQNKFLYNFSKEEAFLRINKAL